MARNMAAPKVIRSQATPPEPITGNRLTDNAAADCAVSIAATVSDQAGSLCSWSTPALRPTRRRLQAFPVNYSRPLIRPAGAPGRVAQEPTPKPA